VDKKLIDDEENRNYLLSNSLPAKGYKYILNGVAIMCVSLII